MGMRKENVDLSLFTAPYPNMMLDWAGPISTLLEEGLISRAIVRKLLKVNEFSIQNWLLPTMKL